MTSGKLFVVVGIAAVAVGATILDRLDHRQFAESKLCQSEGLRENAGRFAKLHCLYHAEEWSAPGKWISHGINLLVPNVGSELSFAVGHALLNAL